MDPYAKRKRLEAEYDRLAADADWHGLTWALERQLDDVIQEMSRVQEQIDKLESDAAWQDSKYFDIMLFQMQNNGSQFNDRH
jgi:hypothetical protein